ncbi:MAG: ATP-binding protein [Lachnospiraceae bacterium]|nr:ATP-binding protein [Lachnospiraceae bacterium]MBQ2577552.1 ATP-binding protein [Lachnospiraceae bacterium]MCR4732187.1 ATP-binding protein [Lachnospiraceae bacterium]MEE3355583.1 DUF234 domain-containing protein [Candidatus Weimeria sp.]
MESRHSDKQFLQKVYEDNGNAIVLITTSANSEKEGLLKNFLKDKKYFYYDCDYASPRLQLSLLQRQVSLQCQQRLAHDTYDECFSRIRSGDASKLVVIIDHMERVGKKNREFFDSLARLRNKQLYPGPVMILMILSSYTWDHKDLMEQLGEKLAGSIDHRLRVGDISFLDLVRCLGDYSVRDSVQTYGVIGGTPRYLSRWNPDLTFRENVCQLILSPSGSLFRAAEEEITRELREPEVYNTILYAMANGKEKLNDIFTFTGYSRPKISVYLKNLAAFDVIEKVISFDAGGWDHAKKGVYRIRNNFIAFYYHFIYANRSALFQMSSEQFYDTYIAPGLADYMQRAFVDVCREYLSLLNMMGKLPLTITKMGTWVGKEGTVDLVGENDIREYVAAICNWHMDAISMQDYENLQKNLKLACIKTKVVYLFSATSFTEDLRALAEEDPSIVLVDMRSL